MAYITRQEMLEEVERVRRGIEEGKSTKWVVKRLDRLEKQSGETFGKEPTKKDQKKLREIIRANPGIGFRQLAQKSGMSRNWVRVITKSMDDVEEVVNHDARAYYGNKPIGLWFIDDEDIS